MATILVTGGASYVGSHVCKALAQHGHVPVTYDNLSRGHRELVKWGPLEVGDIHDTTTLVAAMRRHGPTAVMHFASYIFVDESVSHPELYHHNIVDGTVSVLRAMAETGIDKIVVSSSCAVYGIPEVVPIAETAPCKPMNPYGAAKLAMEHELAAAESRQNLVWTALRYFNAADADPDGDTGEWHEPEPHLIPRLLDAALGKISEITIHGTDYPTADGTCVRDYIHVADLADAHIRALEYMAAFKKSSVFNLGSGGGFSVKNVVTAVERVTGRPISLQIGPRRNGDPAILVADSERALKVLGWTTRRLDLTTQITDAWAWHHRLQQA